MGLIICYLDVCWMLVILCVEIFVVWLICLVCVVVIDMLCVLGEVDWVVWVVFLILIVKVYGMDVGICVVDIVVQVYGGMGYIEEIGVVQYLCDVCIILIYEGMNGIQVMDFVGCKFVDGGVVVMMLLDEIFDGVKLVQGEQLDLVYDVWQVVEMLCEVMQDLLDCDLIDCFVGVVFYLVVFVCVLGVYYYLWVVMCGGLVVLVWVYVSCVLL